MDAQISVGQLLTVILILAGIAVLYMVFKALKNINDIFNNIATVVKRNEKNIDDILISLPKILNNTEEITKSVNEDMQHVTGVIKSIEETVGLTASAAQFINDDFVLPARDILEILGSIKSIFVKEKKRSWLSK